MTPLPLPVQQEELVIVQITNGIADTSTVHLPARTLQEKGWGTAFAAFDFPPVSWPSACRQVSSGAVYVRSGPFADAVVCPECEEAA